MSDFDWAAFWREYNQELLASAHLAEALRYRDDEGLQAATAAGWLGRPGATEEQLRSVEARLGSPLPPSYREFLAFSNGWWYPSGFIPRLWRTDEIEWLAVSDPHVIEAWSIGEPGGDEEYFVYGEDQSTLTVRPEYLRRALRISEREFGGTAMYLLIPDVVTPEGEWEAWMLAHWLPGAQRYRSFRELMEDERKSFLSLEAHQAKRVLPGDPLAQLPAKLPNLIGELDQKAHTYREIYDRQTPPDEGTLATAQALDDVGRRVREIETQNLDPTMLLASLKALTASTIQEHQELHARRKGRTPGRLEELRRGALESARAEGLRQAAGLIEWFLGDLADRPSL